MFKFILVDCKNWTKILPINPYIPVICIVTSQLFLSRQFVSLPLKSQDGPITYLTNGRLANMVLANV